MNQPASLRTYLTERERDLIAQIRQIRRQLNPLEADLADIQRAKAALEQADANGPPSSIVSRDPIAEHLYSTYAAMTMKELVLKALAEYFGNGATAQDLIGFFAANWGRKISRPNLSPQLTRLKRDGLVENIDGKWVLASRPLIEIINSQTKTAPD